ncbi:MAG: hypothetical protein QGG90_11365 [Nitrospinota bacterium]|nr:hypothetical protein [Nitrospinota bacterium]MDP6620020.1 hypothetical protein [Nitrospinota bacterium]HJM44105.1 hypothetical protein [Nitrospinota bacterium]
MNLQKRPRALWPGLLLAVLCWGASGEALAQNKPALIAPPLDSVLKRFSRRIDPALKKVIEERRRQLLEMGWLEFWEREQDVWERIVRLQKEDGSINERLFALEREKGKILGRLRRLYREKSPLSKRMNDLLALRNLAHSILPLAAKRAKASGEIRALLREWMLFQDLAQDLIRRESGRGQQVLAAGIIGRFLEAFQKGNTKDISRLMLRGVRVNGHLDRRAYLRHLQNYFRRVRVTSYRVKDRDFREVNPFTLRVRGKYEIEETEIVKDDRKKPRQRGRTGEVSFTLREIGGKWLISKMSVPE